MITQALKFHGHEVLSVNAFEKLPDGNKDTRLPFPKVVGGHLAGWSKVQVLHVQP
jgi:hypothetical protein